MVGELPSEIGALSRVVQGLLIHSDWLAAYGLDAESYRSVSRDTLPVSERLDGVFETDARSLGFARPPAKRAVGTCRDFALMLCSFLRCKGVPSRVRCGFAAYFSTPWEDHWVCEYWDANARTWRIADPQIDPLLKDRCRIPFDLNDVPATAFATAGQAWLRYRRDAADPENFGHGAVVGRWFIKINVVRDHYVLNGQETSAWDGWRAAPPSQRVIGEHEIALLDDLAAYPQQRLVEVTPDWLG